MVKSVIVLGNYAFLHFNLTPFVKLWYNLFNVLSGNAAHFGIRLPPIGLRK